MKSLVTICALLFFTTQACWGQSPALPVKVLKGSVAGHVYCADTNAPARLANVTIEPASDLDDIDPKAKVDESRRASFSVEMVPVQMDGSYLLQNIAPGRYYILAEMQGYVSPLAQFTESEMSSLDTEVRKHIRSVLQTVNVVGGETAHIDFSLRRGAAISGKIFYDDGSPAVGSTVSLLRKEEDGSWKPLSNGLQGRAPNKETTDDLGRYRIAALPPGEYMPSVEIDQGGVSVSGAFLGTDGYAYSGYPQKDVSIYLGDTARRSEAKSVTLPEGAEVPGVDIMVPASKFHTIDGSLISQEDGHPLNDGSIKLLDPSDRSTIRAAHVDHEKLTFSIDMVPEGDYVLQVTEAGDAVGKNLSFQDARPNWRFTLVHSFLDTEQSLNVKGDDSNVVVKLLPQPADSGKKQDTAGNP